jgi:hypothetical protein
MREARIAEKDINDFFLDMKYPTIKSEDLNDAPTH